MTANDKRLPSRELFVSLVLAACMLATPSKALSAADAEPLSRPKYLLLDGRVVAETANTRLAVGSVRKHPANPLFVEDKPWEVRFDNLYANVIFDDEANLYKCWYSPFVIDKAVETTSPEQRTTIGYGDAMQALVKAGKWQREMGVCYATSQDGLNWTKPEMNVRLWKGQPSNILDIGPHGAGIFKDFQEKDAGRRYKMFTGNSWAFSADGIHWTEPTPCPEVNAVADTHNNALWVPELNCYVGITRNWVDNQRIVSRTQSNDFTRWSKAAEVFRGTPRCQIYAMNVFRYAGTYLGLAMIFDTHTDRVYCELASSPDTIRWQRIDEGVALIPNSNTPGDYDWGTVYAAAYPVFLDNEIRLYYGAGNGPHTNWRDGSLALATLRPDGFAGIRTVRDEDVGTIVTQPVVCTGRHLRLTADAAGGSLSVEVLDGKLGQSRPISGNVTDELVKWDSAADLSAFVGKPIRLRIELRKSTLYAFRFE